MEKISVDEIRDKLDFFKKMYDAVRLVDPVAKAVLDSRGACVERTAEVCYNYWKTGEVCANCISVRAYSEGRSFVKLEKHPNEYFLISAVPIECAEMPVVLELLKNITDSMLIATEKSSDDELFKSFVSRMNAMVVRDPLTGLYNRRFSSERLPMDIIEAEVAGQPLSVCFLDIDDFKRINDAYGHEAGDMALRAVSDRILRLIRSEYDWAARFGGDEFIVCLRNTGKDRAAAVAGRLAAVIGGEPVVLPGGAAYLSVSWGAISTEEEKLTAEDMISAADRRMYGTKTSKQADWKDGIC